MVIRLTMPKHMDGTLLKIIMPDKKTSDVDILVEFEKPIGFFKFLELEEYLSELIGKDIDLVSKKALKSRIGKHILREVAIL